MFKMKVRVFSQISMILFHCKQFPKPIAFCSLLFWLSAELGHLIIIFFLLFVLFSDQTLYTQQETRKELICQKVEMSIFVSRKMVLQQTRK